jgi:branched-subunit amino acid aminotransferase/4-amino-4-deoxychorismate lyase
VIAYQDGAWLDDADLRVSARDPAFLTGHGVFESLRLHRGSYFRLAAHLDRLAHSADLVRIPLPSKALLRDVLLGLAERSGLPDASARITVTAGAPGRGPSLLATIAALPADWRERAARGWRLVTARTRHPDPRTVPPALKSLGRIYSVLARQEARDAGADDALMLLPDGTVAEGPTWNFFFRVEGALHTASTDAVLGGVTRATILELAADAGIRLEVGLPPADLLALADAAFASMSSLGIVPVVALDGRAVPGSVALATPLQAAYWSLVETETTSPA